MGQVTRRLIVVQGLNAGARLTVNHIIKTVGRARDAHLMLDDGAVSRHHFHVVAADRGVSVHVCDGAAPILHDGREVREAMVKVGDTFVVGDTVLGVTETIEVDAPAPMSEGSRTTSARALLTGISVDVRGLAAVFALDEALAEAKDIASVEATLTAWARMHAECEAVELVARAEEHVDPDDDLMVLETAARGGRTTISVPVYGSSTKLLAFATRLTPDKVTDSWRRLFVVAGRICASRLAQLSTLLTVKEDRESLRRQAVGSAHAFLGVSAQADELVRVIPRLAASAVTVLLTGETGVGKTFVARLIHEAGPRKEEPFRVINCASIPENLIESELFGHERGAFTGAVTAQRGAFEAAGRGTVLLDEIGELPLASQAKLLRVLEDKRFERLGSNRSLPLDARILAATNRDLDAMVAAGTFRNDLYFRISVVTRTVPPLRERGDDLIMLAQRILADLSQSAGRRVEGFTPEALDLLRRYPWPGNVRELRNAIEHALVLGDGRRIEVTDFPAAVRCIPRAQTDDAPSIVRLPANLEWLEQKAIEEALRFADGNRARAAALLGIKPAVLYYKLRRTATAGEP